MNQSDSSQSHILIEIAQLVQSINHKNQHSQQAKLLNLTASHRPVADSQYLRCLFGLLELHPKDDASAHLLADQIVKALQRTNFVTALSSEADSAFLVSSPASSGAAAAGSGSANTGKQLVTALKRLKLNSFEEVAFLLVLTHCSRSDLRLLAGNQLKSRLRDLLSTFVEADFSDHTERLLELGIGQLQFILEQLTDSPEQSRFEISDLLPEFKRAVRKSFGEETPALLRPVLPVGKTPQQAAGEVVFDSLQIGAATQAVSQRQQRAAAIMSNGLADLVMQKGYAITQSVETFRKAVQQATNVHMSTSSVALCLVRMISQPYGPLKSPAQNYLTGTSIWEVDAAETASSADGGPSASAAQQGAHQYDKPGQNTWQAEVFVNAIKELSPSLSWRDVLYALDHKELNFRNDQSFKILLRTMQAAIGLEAVPISDLLYARLWDNKEAQLGFIYYALKHPDWLSLSDVASSSGSVQRLVSTDVLKTPPDLDNREIRVWRSQDLVNVLIELSQFNFQRVYELFQYPLTHCPDLLLLALIGSSLPSGGSSPVGTSAGQLKENLLTKLMPIFLGTHPNSAPVLQMAWTTDPNGPEGATIRTIIMQAMAQYYDEANAVEPAGSNTTYSNSTKDRLARVLEVAQELKALNKLFPLPVYPFAIDLACLACIRGYLKMEKWLKDRIQEQSSTFVNNCIEFMEKVCPELLTRDTLQNQLPKHLYETFPLIIRHLSEELSQVSNNRMLNAAEKLKVMSANVAVVLPPKSQVTAPMLGTAGVVGQKMGVVGGPVADKTMAEVMALEGNVAGAMQAGLGIPSTTQPAAQPAINTMGTIGPAGAQFRPQNNVTSSAPASNILGGLSELSNVPPSNLMSVPSVAAAAVAAQQQQQQAELERAQMERQANEYYKRFFAPTNSQQRAPVDEAGPTDPPLTPGQFYEVFRRLLSARPDSRELKLGQFMLNCLFDEFRYFNDYPPAAVSIVGELFGYVLRDQLPQPTGVHKAAQLLIDSIKASPSRSAPSDKYVLFARTALERMATGLSELDPQRQVFVNRVFGVVGAGCHPAAFAKLSDQLQSLLRAGVRQLNLAVPPHMQSPPPQQQQQLAAQTQPAVQQISLPTTDAGSTATSAGSRPSLVAVASSAGLNTVKPPEPPQAVQEKILFLVNNLSMQNMRSKLREFQTALSKEHMAWFSYYLVDRRISTETNFHKMYDEFCYQMDTVFSGFSIMVYKDMMANVRKRLEMAAKMNDIAERTTMRNLGHFLGMLRLARNKPILGEDLEVKPLLYEAYHRGEQEVKYVVTFICKMIEHCPKSVVFAPPSPWTMGIVMVLYYIMNQPTCPIQLQYDIKLVFGSLNVTTDELEQLHMGNLAHNRCEYMEDMSLMQRLLPQMSSAMPQSRFYHQFAAIPTDPFATPAGHGAANAPAGYATGPSAGGVPASNETASSGLVIGGPSASGTLADRSIWPNVMPASTADRPQLADEQLTVTGATTAASITNAGDSQRNLQNLLNQTAPPSSSVAPFLAQQPVVTASTGALPDTAASTGRAAAATTKPPATTSSSGGSSSGGLLMLGSSSRFSYDELPSRSNFVHFVSQHVTGIDSLQKLTISRQNALHLVADVFCSVINQDLGRLSEEILKDIKPTVSVIVCKDFHFDSDPMHLLNGARSLWELIVCKRFHTFDDQFRVQMRTQLAAKLLQTSVVPQLLKAESGRSLFEQIVEHCCNAENVELVRSVLCKIINEELFPRVWADCFSNECDLRKRAQFAGRPAFDVGEFQQMLQRLPEGLVAGPDGPTKPMLDVYANMRRIRGFREPGDHSAELLVQHLEKMGLRAETLGPKINELIVLINDLKSLVDEKMLACQLQMPVFTALQPLFRRLMDIIVGALSTVDRSPPLECLSKLIVGLVEQLLDGPVHEISSSSELAQVSKELIGQLLKKIVLFFPGNAQNAIQLIIAHAWNRSPKRDSDGAVHLVKAQIVGPHFIDQILVNMLEPNNSAASHNFALKMISVLRLLVDNPEKQFPKTLERMNQLQHGPNVGALPSTSAAAGAGGGTAAWPESSAAGSTSMPAQSGAVAPGTVASSASGAGPIPSEDEIKQTTKEIMDIWSVQYQNPQAVREFSDPFLSIINQMKKRGMLRTDDAITRFIEYATQLCVDNVYLCLASSSMQPSASKRANGYRTVDAFVKLMVLFVRHTNNESPKVSLLWKLLTAIYSKLLDDHKTKTTSFDPMPYYRMFIQLFIELNAPEPSLEQINYFVIDLFHKALHHVRPALASGFAWAWLDIISHRAFLPRYLQTHSERSGWMFYAHLLEDVFDLIGPYLRNGDLSRAMQMYYKGLLRVMLVLLHDFPDFLCEYHFQFCNKIPYPCVQLRNLVLSAFPKKMKLPDPFTPNLKVDQLPEITHTPQLPLNYSDYFAPEFRQKLDSYLSNRSPTQFLAELRNELKLPEDQQVARGMTYNLEMLNALVLYVGIHAIEQIQSKNLQPGLGTISHSATMDIFQTVSLDLDNQGRYLLFNSIANHLRYPNSHTHYFSCTLLHLFTTVGDREIKEMITRVLTERLIVNRPHPWGLLVTFIELLKNRQYGFWENEFVNCAPEITSLFQSVYRSMEQAPRTPPHVSADGYSTPVAGSTYHQMADPSDNVR